MSAEATVKKWAQKSKDRLRAVKQESSQRLANRVKVPRSAGGQMPVVTGHLRRSLLASTTAMPSMIPGYDEGAPDNDAQITLAIAAADIGDPIYLGFTAIYARRMNRLYGFVDTAAQDWQQIVDDSVRAVRGRSLNP